MGTATKGIIAGCLTAALATGCTSEGRSSGASPSAPTSPAQTSATTSAPTSGEPGQTSGSVPTSEPPETSEPPSRPVRFLSAAAMRTVRFLAGKVGPREASSADYRRAARWVEGRFDRLGYDVQRQRVHVPAGNSWGIDVPSGVTWNVVATWPGFESTEPHLVVGAHLDTVPQAPGAEDNASGVSVVVELARMASKADTRLPVMFVAFGGEEPRGDGDELHHFGSTAMVDRLSRAQRRATQGMVALDRVGVGTVVPVCAGGLGSPSVRGAVIRAAQRVDVPTSSCVNTSSDHWSFEKAGMRAARVGGTSYAAYHSAADVPSVVSQAQLARVGRVVWEWLAG
jgi:hypothetical protein